MQKNQRERGRENGCVVFWARREKRGAREMSEGDGELISRGQRQVASDMMSDNKCGRRRGTGWGSWLTAGRLRFITEVTLARKG